MRVTILGCGSSSGVPLLGCDCRVCTASDLRNRRLRASILVERGPTAVLVDSSPDLRAQLLSQDVKRLDAVLYTHFHADHVHGIDELRSINFLMKRPLAAYGDRDTLARIQDRFGYIFEPPTPEEGPWYRPRLEPRVIDGPFQVGTLGVTPFTQLHGAVPDRHPTLGFRFGAFAYSTDVKELTEESFAALAGVEVWAVDCLSERPSPAHSHLDQTLDWIRHVQPRRAILTHMSHTLDYASLAARLPPGVEPAYDGMVVELPD